MQEQHNQIRDQHNGHQAHYSERQGFRRFVVSLKPLNFYGSVSLVHWIATAHLLNSGN